MGKKLYKKRKTQRGGDSASYGFGSAVARGAPYAQEVVAKEACGAATRPGTLVGYSAGSGGLPGLTGFAGGGTRRAKKSKKFSLNGLVKSFKNFFKGKQMKKRVKSFKNYFKSKKQRGGRWTADTAAAYATGPNVFLPATRIGCEGGLVNTSPPGAQNPAMAFKQMGGAGTLASPYYSAQTAGYTNQPSTWVSPNGTPSLLQTPYDARALNPACLKTGGGYDDDDNNNDQDGGARRRRKSKSKAKRRR